MLRHSLVLKEDSLNHNTSVVFEGPRVLKTCKEALRGCASDITVSAEFRLRSYFSQRPGFMEFHYCSSPGFEG